jgi:hypothetical protein
MAERQVRDFLTGPRNKKPPKTIIDCNSFFNFPKYRLAFQMIITRQIPVRDPSFSRFITAPPIDPNMGLWVGDPLSRKTSEISSGNHP